MEHIFEEYCTEITNKPLEYVLVISNKDCDENAIDLCNQLIENGWYVLCNTQLMKHPRFIYISDKNNTSYYIHRIYNIY